MDRDVVVSDGTRLRTRSDGAGETALLLCNSLGTDLTSWDRQVETLQRGRRVIRFDQRGHGSSDVPVAPYDVERLGRDALEVLDAHGVDRADVCGLSLGGLVAIWLASTEPGRVRRLVLAATAGRIGDEAGWRQRAAAVRHGGMDAVVDQVLDRFCSPGFRGSDPDAVDDLEQVLRTTAVEGYAGSCEALAVADLRSQVSHIEAPTLILAGDIDQATPPTDAEDLRDRIDGAELRWFEQAGHLVNIEQPLGFNDLVDAFLRGGS